MDTQHILLVEDDDNDSLLLELAIHRAHLNFTLTRVDDGINAIDYLSGARSYNDRGLFPWPSLLLLDLHMRRCDGIRVLEWLEQNPSVRTFAVVVLSGADPAADQVLAAARLCVDAFIPKTSGFLELLEALRTYATNGSVASFPQLATSACG